LTRSEPQQADRMLGHLIQYLRHSLPSTDGAMSTLGDELERTRAYLEILRIRMGPRLALEVDVPDALRAIQMPSMMLQTLVENAIKHGLEPKPGGGTGIGLKNVRERLRLIYGERATLSVVANAPEGVAATITVPAVAAATTVEPEAVTP
jgi:LytS/YehU family sensor histidine kinase